MRIAVTGSIAIDHLMTFPGRFSEQLLADHLDRVSLSFLVDDLEVRPGGVASNIAFGLGALGLRPVLVGAVGSDFEPHRVRLKQQGVDTDAVLVSETMRTARFVCTTDAGHNQIGSFYSGAMSEARRIDLGALHTSSGGFDLVIVSPDDPVAMVQHTRHCARLGLPFAADPSQQLAGMGRDDVRALLAAPRFLFTNEYESVLIQERTGWTEQQILGRTGTWVITRGADGSLLKRAGRRDIDVPAVLPSGALDPTGAGDAFRAGFLAAHAWGLAEERSAQLGSALATAALETTGTQEYEPDRGRLLARIRGTYGVEAAEDLAAHLRGPK